VGSAEGWISELGRRQWGSIGHDRQTKIRFRFPGPDLKPTACDCGVAQRRLYDDDRLAQVMKQAREADRVRDRLYIAGLPPCGTATLPEDLTILFK
jgi:hypothetical protein